MVVQNRRGFDKPEKDTGPKHTALYLHGEYEEDDILWCSCELVYPKHTDKYDNVVYAPSRGMLLEDLRSKLKRMPAEVNLYVEKIIGKVSK